MGAAPRFAALTALLLSSCLATQALASRGQSVSLSAGLSSVYDDNFLQFSDNQLADFASGLHPLRYSVESTDDGLFAPDAAITWQLDEGSGRRHALRLRAAGDYRAHNPTADHFAAGARWTESFARGRRFTAGWYFVNNFYLRQLRDEDLPVALGDYRYQRAQFDLNIYSAAWRQRLGRSMHADVAYQFEDRHYVPAFQERNAGTHQPEVRVDWDHLPRQGGIEVHGGYRLSHAQATDGDEIGGVHDDDDLSYHGYESGIAGHMEFHRQRRWGFGGDLATELETRNYDSDRTADRYHYGRHDIMYAVEAGLRLAYRPHWGFRAFYRFESNAASLSAFAPPASESGSYRQNVVGLEIDWSGMVWHQSPPTDEEGGE